MKTLNPTTQAIVVGLCTERISDNDYLAHIAIGARALADTHALPRRNVIIQAAQDGWDLGIRTTGNFSGEITASRRFKDTELRLLVTALIDKRSVCGWTYLWAVQSEGPVSVVSTDFYPNGVAESFADAIRLVELTALSRSI